MTAQGIHFPPSSLGAVLAESGRVRVVPAECSGIHGAAILDPAGRVLAVAMGADAPALADAIHDAAEQGQR